MLSLIGAFSLATVAEACSSCSSSDRNWNSWNSWDFGSHDECGVDPECGDADGRTYDAEPTEGLCAEGYATGMTEDGEDGWSWACESDSSRETDYCYAEKTPTPEPEPEPEPEPTPEPEPEDDDDDECDNDSSIGDLVWNDRNRNGVRDAGEEGLSGITMKLIHGNDVDKDNTDHDGKYGFDDLCKGTYTVVVDANDLGQGCYPTYDRDGKLDHTTKVSLGRDEEYKKADFGYYCPSGATAPRTGTGALAFPLAGGIAGAAVFLSRKYLARR